MAAYHATYQTDLAGPSRVIAIPSIFAMGDNESHTFTVQVYDSRNPEAGLLAGTVAGVVVRPDGATVPLTGTKGEETVDVTLPDGSTAQATECSMTLIQGCFAYAGQITIVIRLVDGEAQTAVFVARGTVTTSLTDTVVDPGEVVPDIATLLAAVEACEEATAAAQEAADHAVQYDAAQTLTDAQKTQARTNIGAAGTDEITSLDGRVNAVHSMVDYGYSEVKDVTGFKRIGTQIIVNNTWSSNSGPIAFKLNGAFASGTSTSAIAGFTNPIKLTVGRKYRWQIQQISGTVANGSDVSTPKLAYPAVYTSGSSTLVVAYADVQKIKEGHYAADFVYTSEMDTAGGAQLCLGIRRNAGAKVGNLVCQMTLEDITTAGDANIAPVEGVTAASTHNSGDLILSAGTLYKATASIAVGDAIASYASPTTVAAQLQANEAAITAEATARAAEDADVYMEPWMLMCKKYCITEGNGAFEVKRNHITYAPTSSAGTASLRVIVGTYAARSATLANYTPVASELIPVSVFGSAIKMGFYVNHDTAGRTPRLAYKFCTVDGDTVTPIENGHGTVPGTAANDVISEATVSVPNGATHVFFCIAFSSGYYVGTYDMVYKIDKG